MSEPRATPELDVSGPAAPPRDNGELVFDAPWQSRVFGITMALCNQGALDWEAFRQSLIDEISRVPDQYWVSWQNALELQLEARGLAAGGDVAALARRLAERPPGHDHRH